MAEPGFGALRVTLRIFCVIPFVTGAVDMIGGAKFLAATGANLPPQSIADPLLNNQMGFWGGIWFGFGITLWYASARLRTDPALLRILLGVLFLSGVGRAISVAFHGWTVPVLTAAMLLELIGPALIWLWHARLLSSVRFLSNI